MTITFEDMREKLLPLDKVREVLGRTEPLSEFSFSSSENAVKFALPEGSTGDLSTIADYEPTECTVTIDRRRFNLTKAALLQCTSKIGLTQKYVQKTPAALIAPHLNYWFSNPGTELKFLTAGDNAVAATKASITPFSNLHLLDDAVASVAAKFGSDIMVDPKFVHSLKQTHLRLVFPGVEHQVRGRQGHTFCGGLQLKNSLTGMEPLALNAYTFDYWCLNGQISTYHQSGNYSRRHNGQGEEAYEWARLAVDDLLESFEAEFIALDRTTDVSIEGDVNDVLRELFEHYKVPLEARASIIAQMVESDDLTLFGVLRAITQAANNAPTPEQAERLMLIGGDIPHHPERCEACRRVIH